MSALDENEVFYLSFKLAGLPGTSNPAPEVWGYQFELQFNPQKVDILEVIPVFEGVHPIEQEAFCVDQQNCTVRTLWYSNGANLWRLPRMFQTQKLFAVKLKAKVDMQYGELGNYVGLNTNGFENQFLDENLNILPVDLYYGITESEQIKLQSIYPVPFQDNVSFQFQIEQGDSPIIITLTDQFGNQATTTRYYSYFGSTVINMGTSNLASGNVTAQIKIGQDPPFTKLLSKITN